MAIAVTWFKTYPDKQSKLYKTSKCNVNLTKDYVHLFFISNHLLYHISLKLVL